MKKTIPLEKIYVSNRFLITADIEVSPNVFRTFIIDTGAMRTAIDTGAIEKLKISTRGVNMPRLLSSSSAHINGVLADVEWYGIKREIIVSDYSSFLVNAFTGIAGIIGNDFLGEWNAVIDLRRLTLTISL